MGGSRLPDVTFGEWLPDQSRVKSPGLTRCENVVPTARGYRAWPSRSLVIGKDPLVGPCVGAWSGESQSGVKFTVAGTGVGGVSAGPALHLIWGEGGAVWNVSPVSAITGLEATGTWSFTRVGKFVIATAERISEPLKLEIDPVPSASSDFSVISSDASRASVCAEFKEFLVLGDVVGRGVNASAIGTAENGIHWSALGDPESFPTVGTQTAVDAQSDFQVFGGEGGAVTNIIPSGEFCLIFQETQIWRMDYVGKPAIFSFRNISTSTGCTVRNGAIAANGVVFFVSEDGYRMCDGSNVVDIGSERVDRTFNDLFDAKNAHMMSSAYVPRSNCVLWSVPEGSLTPSRIFGYQFELNRWFQILNQDRYQWLFSAHSIALGGSLDSLPLSIQNMDSGSELSAANLDSLGVSDGAGTAAFFDQNNAIAFYGDDGDPMAGYLEIGDYEAEDRARHALRWVRPIWDGPNGAVIVTAGGRNYITEETTMKNLSYSLETGISRVQMSDRIGGRYLRALFICANEYEEVTGFDVGFSDGGGRR